jgi:hypothetical protein
LRPPKAKNATTNATTTRINDDPPLNSDASPVVALAAVGEYVPVAGLKYWYVPVAGFNCKRRPLAAVVPVPAAMADGATLEKNPRIEDDSDVPPLATGEDACAATGLLPGLVVVVPPGGNAAKNDEY